MQCDHEFKLIRSTKYFSQITIKFIQVFLQFKKHKITIIFEKFKLS